MGPYPRIPSGPAVMYDRIKRQDTRLHPTKTQKTSSQPLQCGSHPHRQFSTNSATDNLRPQDDIYPDQDAPVLTNAADGGLELRLARWGFSPIPGQTAPITNIRN